MSISLGHAIRPDHPRCDSTLHWAEAAGKRFFVLRQRGSLPDISYDHGQLLAQEIEDGVFPEIIDTIRTGTDTSSDTMDWILRAVYRRMSDDVFSACDPEFQAAIRELGEGMFDTLDNPKFTPEDVRDALVAIDTGNLADGLTRRVQKPLAADATGTIIYVLGAVRRFRKRSRFTGQVDDSLDDRGKLGRGLQALRSPSRRAGFGCTAAGVAPSLSADGLGLHARTFDGAFFDWNKTPGLMIADERETNPDWHRYVAVGTAGLFYSGGISGLNDQGLACSIHQMSTARTDTGRPGRRYALAPYLQQRILREAATLDEAHEILTDARHFAAWTIVVSDAKTGQAARWEICGGGKPDPQEDREKPQRVVRTDLGQRFSQSNHFLAEEMAERHDHFGDTHYTPTFGKWLESRARIATVEAALEGTAPDTDWAIALLAGHKDGELGGTERSFGRTICKAYGIMGTVARTDPDRARAADQIWFAIGNAFPGPHATFAGFEIDWDALELRPCADRPVRQPGSVSGDFAAASAEYVAAFRAVARPTDTAGAYLGRDPTETEAAACRAEALGCLDRACQLAEDAGETDFAFRYARARLRHEAADWAGAADDWAFLRRMAESGFQPVHDWERVLVWTLSAATEQAAGREATSLLDEAERRLSRLRRDRFPSGPAHPDLDKWGDVIADLQAGKTPELPELDFVTVE